jgi:hypothetical protein
MISVTEESRRVFRAIAPALLPEGKALRLERGWHGKTGKTTAVIRVAKPTKGDQPVMTEAGKVLLYVSEEASWECDGCVLDVEATPEGVRCTLRPPEAGRHARS